MSAKGFRGIHFHRGPRQSREGKDNIVHPAWAHHPISSRTWMSFIGETKPRGIMKRLLLAVGTVVLFTGCYSNSHNQQRYGDGSHPQANDYRRVRDTDGPNDRSMQKSSNNLGGGLNH